MFNKKSGGALRWFEGKRLLANIRGGDYAHAGEEEAIEKVFSNLKKSKNRSILDVGSGRGGTANYIQKHGWGRVTGIDIEKESVQYSKNKYPAVSFFVGDACSETKLMAVFHKQKFDLITLFNSLCVFPKQKEAIKALRKFAHNNTQLIIFEYEGLTLQNNPLNKTQDDKTYFYVNNREQFKTMLNEGGWYIDEHNIINITDEFKRWYEMLLYNLEQKKTIITEEFGKKYYERAKKRYGGMVNAIDCGVLGGCIIYAFSSPEEN